MIDLEFVRGLIRAVDQSGIDSLEISRGGTRVRIAKTPPAPPAAVNHAPVAQAAPPPPPAAAAPPPSAGEPPAQPAPAAAPARGNLVDVKSPMVGTFYRSPSPEAPAYVETGSKVTRGQTLCILEAMKLMNELESEVAGTIREICVENAEPVEFGQVLFRVEPA